ncbi:MAG: flippase-like domain-containing protein [Bacteroidota bacterium]|nr:flippase-like domain-containing protein [Bacteroidota bacterium]MDX5430312.1 flippase-like domain-containing protein [Bacteroidota bacterium]MDX5469073.1 flippase-like domain-containing protein [Bacteroidota bacterium]
MKKALQYLIFILIGAFFIYMAFKEVKPDELWEKIKHANFMWIGLAILAGMISNYSRAARWLIIAEPLGYKPRLSTSFHGVMVSYLVNFAIPRGGEITRAAMVSKAEKMPLATVIGSVVAERVTDLICMGLVILLAMGLQYDIIMEFFSSSSGNQEAGTDAGFPWMKVILAVGFVGGMAFLFIRKRLNHINLFKKINHLADSFIEGVKGLARIKKPIAFTIHSIIIWVMYYLMVFFCFYCIPETSHLGAAAGLTVLVTSTLAVVLPSPGGIGTFHYFVPIALTLYGIDPADGLSYATIAHASQMLMFIFFCTISLISMIISQRKDLAG